MDMDFFKSLSLLYIHFAEKLDISNLFPISRLVSDILSKQECARRGESCRDEVCTPDSESRVTRIPGADRIHVGQGQGAQGTQVLYGMVFPRNNIDSLPMKTCCVLN